MRHNGVAFPPEYEPRGLTVKIKGIPHPLEPLQEEMLMAWAKKIGTPYVEDPVFQHNFIASLRARWPELFGQVSIADIDFGELQQIAASEKLSNLPPEQRKQVSAERKRAREELKEKYGYAYVDGLKVEIGAYLVEPPGIFMGRGAHPLRGKWKSRIRPEDVELNLDEDAPIPEPMFGGEWKGIVHEHDGLWVARWKDELADKLKYVWLAETSHLRQEREQEKYDKATKLAAALPAVRKHIHKGMRDKNIQTRKMATVAELIDRLAMRVGDEKDEDEADTVGASTLRVEHVKFHTDRIEFDFLGKDSVPWEKDLPINEETALLAKNLQEFMRGKRPDEQIFPEIRSSHVNRFLGKAMPGLTAKVFRTFEATNAVERALPKDGNLRGKSEFEKDFVARRANLEAAITCNHKRTPPKTWAESLAKREAALEKLRANKPDLNKLDQQLSARQAALEKLKDQQKKFEAEAPAQLEKKKQALAQIESEPLPDDPKARAKWEKRFKAAEKALREAEKEYKAKSRCFKQRIKQANESLERAREARERAMDTYQARVEKAERQLELAKLTRDYNLNTSLKNYIDPRVYYRWGKRVGYDWKRLYTKTLQRKFAWVEREEQAQEPAEAEQPAVAEQLGDATESRERERPSGEVSPPETTPLGSGDGQAERQQQSGNAGSPEIEQQVKDAGE